MTRGPEQQGGMTIRLKPPQWKVFRSPERFRVLVAGRRFGKTYLAHLPGVEQSAQFHFGSGAEGISFPSACCFPGLLHGLRGCFLGPPHQQRRWRWRQILKLHVDREAITAELRDDRRAPGFSL